MIAGVPNVMERLEAWVFVLDFESMIDRVKSNLQCMKDASRDLRDSEGVKCLMAAVLEAGNILNAGTSQGDARGFTVDNLVKLRSVKSSDNKMTLLRFVVESVHKVKPEFLQVTKLRVCLIWFFEGKKKMIFFPNPNKHSKQWRQHRL